jgi:hypothetical protein
MQLLNQLIRTALFVTLASFTACSTFDQGHSMSKADPYEEAAKRFGWLENLKRGQGILDMLAALNTKDLARVEVAAYRGERVAFVGGALPRGRTNDLLTGNGIRLRVVTSAGKDLRPHAVWWEVMVYGTILQVIPENKTIVIKVEEGGWRVMQTG